MFIVKPVDEYVRDVLEFRASHKEMLVGMKIFFLVQPPLQLFVIAGRPIFLPCVLAIVQSVHCIQISAEYLAFYSPCG